MKERDESNRYVLAATEAIKRAGPLRALYIAIHGVEPNRTEYQRFSNRLNATRSNPTTDMLGLCIEHLPVLHDMTLGEFFGINQAATTEKDHGDSPAGKA